ncbi:HAD family hydrolase [Motilimonas eburnea]|uniref:HAD family hydrolase n=1 Tax=Motilimonas eburnea TaxID=1737488 RepID=UPI001E41E0D0|nr:HAD family hydrolase [Motilimonas eburnea]MCE2571617.1 HAD-IB family hydrolase [Motilimonas eburnea]
MANALYVFDLDDTLINGDCATIWNEFLVAKGIVIAPNFLEEDKRLMHLYAIGKMEMDDYLSVSLAPLANMPIETVNGLVTECVTHRILPKQFSQASALIEQLHRDDMDMLIISASPAFLVKQVGQALGIPHALGIDLVEQNGCYTPNIRGVVSYRAGKVTRLAQWLASQDKSYATIHFYSDSINDLPLCQYADYTYLVNPCPQLAKHANQPNWTVLQW